MFKEIFRVCLMGTINFKVVKEIFLYNLIAVNKIKETFIDLLFLKLRIQLFYLYIKEITFYSKP